MANFTIPRFRIQDAAGNAIVGGHVHFYESGTTTPKNTYQDSALTVLNTNPVVSGSDGWTPEVWMVSDAYKVVVEDDTGAVLKTYDPYYPAWTVDGTKLAGTSADADPAVLGTNSSTGPGVKAVNSGAGHALWVEGDTSSPDKAALHVVPQDNFPSSPVKGDIVSLSSSGLISGYDGVTESRFLASIYGAGGSILTFGTVGAPDSELTKVIPANTLRAGSKIKIVAGVTVTGVSVSGATEVSIICLDFVAHATRSAVALYDMIYLEATIFIESLGSPGVAHSSGIGIFNSLTGATPVSRAYVNSPIAADTTIDQSILIHGVSAGADVYLNCKLLDVTIS